MARNSIGSSYPVLEGSNFSKIFSFWQSVGELDWESIGDLRNQSKGLTSIALPFVIPSEVVLGTWRELKLQPHQLEREVQLRPIEEDRSTAHTSLAREKYSTEVLGNFLSQLVANKAVPGYAANMELSRSECAAFDVPFAPLVLNEELYEPPRLWAGPGSSTTDWHKDGSKNLVHHLHGEKEWWLLSPRYASRMGLFRPDLDSEYAFSEPSRRVLSRAHIGKRSIRIRVRVGEVLFIPEGWLHRVRALTPSISINWWHKNDVP